MNQGPTPAGLGEPHLKVAGFQLWVHGRERPAAEDHDDGNWLQVTAHCGASGASVWAEGPILMVTDIAWLGDRCAAVLGGEAQSATLDPLEPELRIALEVTDRLGHIRVQVDITPDNMAQAHRFEFEIDQSYLPDIIRQCSSIVRAYPIRGRK
ncbi:MAG: hypothetical protein KF858_13880 [Candidatus Sumerlaeia bacterium]|nr:hypothetical protein [Candidatus Sumerlaeia bacterium]